MKLRQRSNTPGWVVSSIAATFIGTVVGAGFASGQEIYQFFSRYGVQGFLGVLGAVLILGAGGEKVLRIGCKLKPRSYKELLVLLLTPGWARIADLALFSFFTILIGVMFAGCGAVFAEIGFGYWTGIGLSGLILVLVLFRELPGLISANLVIIPLMFFGSLGVAFYGVNTRCVLVVSGKESLNWLLAALQFSAYNLVLSFPVLLSLAREYPLVSFLKLGSWLGSITLGIMAGFIHWSIICHLPHLKVSPLPMIEMARLIGNWAYWAYAAVLWGEMLTTLLANTFGVAQRLVVLTGWPFRRWVLILAVAGIAIAQMGFINLIAGFYPLYGFFCLVVLVLLMIKKV